MSALRTLIVGAGLVLLWQSVVWITEVPPYLLPAPWQVATVWLDKIDLLLAHGTTTAIEILLGLILGTAFGTVSAISMSFFRPLRAWLMPVMVISQALPVFALAPLLVLWLGYGMASKVAMATLIIYFPITVAFHDGLGRTRPGWLALARVMNATPWQIMRRVRIPAALPSLASGLRVAAAVAPIGAIVGEWVGSSAGLGYLMLHALARVQIDLMFAALLTLAILAVALYFTIDAALKRLVWWMPDPAQTTP